MASSYTLGSHYESFVRDLLASGRYASASEVLRDGLRLLEDREKQREAKVAALRDAIQEGLKSGPAAPLDMEAIKARARAERAKAGRA
ncbi:type II toxin-antitoxin system ParD family antitoxin [Shinella curvata]|uniref:Type II toxin-antitoxin system ParD family antitoxin n=1 Tax=Shinella curvata TaxID=1817964 RepID=A0ABT8XKS3_9HYPH|nr:type II toxin-antitoxin system ParD family antitoxin [Shinella curvata]MCJ8052705.1 type II toxin-antitoxin system ParD family antitoxin [Shinella curvata]MDO6123785.1 type II toxin-antitoxin system ParD family antitoxin [Shinella curvata]